MTEAKYNRANWIQYVTAVLVIVSLLLSFGAYTKDVDVNNLNLERQISALDKKIDAGLSVNVDMTDGPKTDAIYDEIFKNDAYKSLGETLALNEIDSKDFKKVVRSAINAELEDTEIESYKDIDQIVVKDIETLIVDENVNVELDLKVYYHVDDDDDEEGRAKISTTITVEDAANEDEKDRDDAEIDKDYIIDIDKIYE